MVTGPEAGRQRGVRHGQQRRYGRIGNTVTGNFALSVVSGGTPGGVITVSRPVPGVAFPGGVIMWFGGAYTNFGATSQMMLAITTQGNETDTFRFIRQDIANLANFYGYDPQITLTAGQRINGSFTYEAAP